MRRNTSVVFLLFVFLLIENFFSFAFAQTSQENIYAKQRLEKQTRLKFAILIGKINTKENKNQCAISVAQKGNVLYYYSHKKRGVYNSIYRSEKIDGKWSSRIEIDEINSDYDDQSPFITSDEKMILFSSNRNGSLEFRFYDGRIGVSRDIYVASKQNGHWQQPIPISTNINTEMIEENPFLIGSRLLFVRYPFGELQKADIYMSEYNGAIWSVARKLPAPLNSEYSDISPVVSADGKILYFASNRPGGHGGYDIYASEIHADGTFSEPVNLGTRINSEGNEASLVNSADGKQFFFCRRKTPQNYDIYTLAKLEDIISQLEKDKKISLESIYFARGKYDIKRDAFPLLDQIATYLLAKKDIRLKVTGHTSLKGNKLLNLQLSKDRANEVKNYLVKKGVNAERIIAEGKGSAEPVYPTINPETDFYNRRTEFEIVK